MVENRTLIAVAGMGFLLGSLTSGGAELAEAEWSKGAKLATQFLDFGGPVYGYVDLDGVLEEALANAEGFVRMMDMGGELPSEMDLQAIFNELGLGGIDLMGLSSIPKGDRYLNKSIVHLGQERRGIFSIPGGAPAEFSVLDLAPKGVDFFYEREFVLSSFFGALRNALENFDEGVVADYEEALSQPLPIGMTVKELTGKMDGKMLFFGRFHSDERLQYPMDPRIEFPLFEVVVLIEGLDWIFDAIVSMAPPQMQQIVQGDRGSRVLQLPPIGPAAYEKIQPTLIEDAENGRVVFTTSMEYWNEALGEGEKARDGEELNLAVQDLPKKGNGFYYISGQASAEWANVVKSVLEALDEDGQVQAGMFEFIEGILNAGGSYEAGVQVNLEEGFYVVIDGDFSHRTAILLGPISAIATLATASFPAMNRVLREAREAEAAGIESAE
ncbi:MAG: hypothetical protein AAGJ79_08345 [Verrucomicrobiota bacterium]